MDEFKKNYIELFKKTLEGEKMRDEFFTKVNCDRCGMKLDTRTMSWFTTETICMICSEKEDEIRKSLPDDDFDYEGCGFVPKINKVN
jgi:hypothetical protein